MFKKKLPRKKFTLIEILVTISIISILISMLIPSLSRSRNRAKQMNCISNMKQIGVAIELYAGDNLTYYPVEDWTAGGPIEEYWTQKVKTYYLSDTSPPGDPIRFLGCPGMSPGPLFDVDTNAKSNYMTNFYLNRQDNTTPASLKNDQLVVAEKTMVVICGSTTTVSSLLSRNGGETQKLDGTLYFAHLKDPTDPASGQAVNLFGDLHVDIREIDDVPSSGADAFWDPTAN